MSAISSTQTFEAHLLPRGCLVDNFFISLLLPHPTCLMKDKEYYYILIYVDHFKIFPQSATVRAS